jgi:hypothetical protein
MAGVINPTDDFTLEDYLERASNASLGVSPGGINGTVFGGELVDASDVADDSEGGDDSDGGDDSEGGDSDGGENPPPEDAAGALQIPILSLLTAVGFAALMA